MGEKETNAGLSQAPAETGENLRPGRNKTSVTNALGQAPAETDANLRPGGPDPVVDTSPPQSAIDPSVGPNPDPQQSTIVKSKSNITNN